MEIQVSPEHLNELVMITTASFKLLNRLKACHERNVRKHKLGCVFRFLMLQNVNEELPPSA